MVKVVQDAGSAVALSRCVLAFLPAFYPLFCFSSDVLGLNMPLFAILRRFLAWFGVVVWVCVGCVLCVACEAFVRVNS